MPEALLTAPRAGPPPVWEASLVLQRLLVAAMVGCVAWTLDGALVAVGLAGPRAFVASAGATVAFGLGLALGGSRRGPRWRWGGGAGPRERALLLLAVLVALRLLPPLLAGPGAFLADLKGWLDDPQRIVDVHLLWGAPLVIGAWALALEVAGDLDRLPVQTGEVAPPPGTRAYDEWLDSPARYVPRVQAWRRLMLRFVQGGVVVLLLAGIAAVRPERLLDLSRPVASGAIPAVLLYYLSGYLLASQSSLNRQWGEWARAGTLVQEGLARRWLAYALLLVGAALVLAWLVPTALVDRLAGAALGAAGHVLAWLVTWLSAFATRHPPGSNVDVPPPPLLPPLLRPLAPPGESAPQPGGPPFRIPWGAFLLLLLVALAGYVLWRAWRARRATWRGLRRAWREGLGLLASALLDVAALLWRLVGRVAPGVLALAPAALQERWGRPRAGAATPARWLHLRRLDARALIQYFYVSLLQRASQLGWRRRPGQTPLEYSRDLAARLPGQAAALDALTEAFLRARYSPRPVADSDARRARRPWEELRGVLRARRLRHLSQLFPGQE